MNQRRIVCSALQYALRVLRTARIAQAASMSDTELNGNAHGLATAILATRWQRKSAIPSWDSIYQQWESACQHEMPDTQFYGQFYPDDQIELVACNKESFLKRDALYTAASRSIDVSTYYIQADETGWRTARALAECSARGVRVRFMADLGVTEQKIRQDRRVSDLIRFLRSSGIGFRLFQNPARPWDAWHRKMLIIDGCTLMTGGRNYADHYAGDQWRDLDLILSGSSVSQAQEIFERTFSSEPQPEPPAQKEGSIFQSSKPESIETNPWFIYLLQCVRASRRRIDIENAYFLHHPPLHRELSAAVKRGVRVRVLANSAESNDLEYANYRLYSGFRLLLEAGVSLYLRRGKGRTLHGKYFVADGEWVGFGSSNLDYYSPRFCHELGIHLRDRRAADILTAYFESGIGEYGSLADPAEIYKVIERDHISRIFDQWFPDMQ